MNLLLLVILLLPTFILGVLSCPFILFLRARNDDAWDDSNMLNIIRLIAHIAAHPSDFSKMQYKDGSKPFWYLDKDEFSEIVKTRPKN